MSFSMTLWGNIAWLMTSSPTKVDQAINAIEIDADGLAAALAAALFGRARASGGIGSGSIGSAAAVALLDAGGGGCDPASHSRPFPPAATTAEASLFAGQRLETSRHPQRRGGPEGNGHHQQFLSRSGLGFGGDGNGQIAVPLNENSKTVRSSSPLSVLSVMTQ